MVRRREVLGGLCAIVFLWFITITRLVYDFCTSDFHAVFVYDGCIGWGTVTVFIGCMMEVVVGSWFLKKFFLPILFGRETWDTFDTLKQQKLVGFLVQIVVRCACTVQLSTILFGGWGSEFTLSEGLFPEHNAKAAYVQLITKGTVTSCAAMKPSEVGALRAWYFSKYHMVAVQIWELSFIPGLPLDTWLHHLFLIAVAAIGSSPDTLTARPNIQPFLDTIGFFFIFGASLNFAVKLCVVMYHYTAPNALRQAKWMEASIVGAWVILVVFYLALPFLIAVWHAEDFGFFVFVFVVTLPILFLAWVEVRLIIVKRSIARNARRKAADRVAREQAGLGQISLSQDLPPSPSERTPTSPYDDAHTNFSWISVGRLRLLSGETLESLDDSAKEARC